jgi:hypothetical protein
METDWKDEKQLVDYWKKRAFAAEVVLKETRAERIREETLLANVRVEGQQILREIATSCEIYDLLPNDLNKILDWICKDIHNLG